MTIHTPNFIQQHKENIKKKKKSKSKSLKTNHQMLPFLLEPAPKNKPRLMKNIKEREKSKDEEKMANRDRHCWEREVESTWLGEGLGCFNAVAGCAKPFSVFRTSIFSNSSKLGVDQWRYAAFTNPGVFSHSTN